LEWSYQLLLNDFTTETQRTRRDHLDRINRIHKIGKRENFDRIYRIFRTVFFQFPDETEKGVGKAEEIHVNPVNPV
jgi:hypothetical protein